MDAFLRLDGEEDLVDGPEDFVNLADGRLCGCLVSTFGHDYLEPWADAHLVLEVDGCIEVGDLCVHGFADNFSFAGMHESAHFCTP